MTPGKYEELAMRSQANQITILERLTSHSCRRWDMQLINGVIGLSDEVGELNSCVKKHVEYGQPLDTTNIQEEVGDCLWRLVQICQAIGYSLEQAMIHNIEKLKVRYPNGYTDYQAAEENRDRATEREILEGLDSLTPQIQLKRGPGPLPEKRYVTNQGFAEPPDEILPNLPDCREETIDLSLSPKVEDGCVELIVSFGDGLMRDKPLNHSYSRYCKQCNKTPVHEHNTTGICPDCTADIRAGRRMNIQEELQRKVEELPIDPPVDGGYSGQTRS